MRGKALFLRDISCSVGITPAYAGKSFQFHFVIDNDWDHPRLCGEKRSSESFCSPEWGSPPPMRGKVLGFQKQHSTIGITPAYAGKRRDPLPVCFLLKDHPRLCGEKCTGLVLNTGNVRITPAYAGKSSKRQ